MREVLAAVRQWRDEGQPIALATIVHAEGSAPRREGARLAVSGNGEMAGSVSGGCVEGDTLQHAQDVLAGGQPRLVRYAISEDVVWEVGLACGGTIEVWVEPWAGTAAARPQADLNAALEAAVADGRLVAQAVLLSRPGRPARPGHPDSPSGADAPGARMLIWPSGDLDGSLGDAALDRQVAADVRAMLDRPHAGAGTREYAAPAARVFVEVLAPSPHLVVVGAVHAAVVLVELAHTMGYRVTVADPRRQFLTPERFPHAERLIAAWPAKALQQIEIGPSTYCVVLTHDPKFDEPALKNLIGRGAGYVGAIGSPKTHAERYARMARHGISAEQLGEVYAPIGLDIGAQTPEEIALAIMAEIVAVRRGAGAGFLRDKGLNPADSTS